MSNGRIFVSKKSVRSAACTRMQASEKARMKAGFIGILLSSQPFNVTATGMLLSSRTVGWKLGGAGAPAHAFRGPTGLSSRILRLHDKRARERAFHLKKKRHDEGGFVVARRERLERLPFQKLNFKANCPLLPPLAEEILPKLTGSDTLVEGPPKICRLKALNISKRNSKFICSLM